ncbi:MAG: hypothetical protein PHF05_03940 [Candidatus Izemoplasmatales bacterium]|nr:hypothetical protein [Candidatus Izemoplasmatales bacterium]
MFKERKIIKRLKERDEEAFEIIYFRYVKLVYHNKAKMIFTKR